MADQMRAYAQQRVQGFATPYRPVEKGVTGREKTFQQNRNFGPGAFPPYALSKGDGSRSARSPRPIPNVRVEPRPTRA